MTEPAEQVSEHEIQAYADGRLDPARREALERYLHEHPAVAARVAGYREQTHALHARFDAVLEEPVPDRLHSAARGVNRRARWRYAVAAAWVACGIGLGWGLRGLGPLPGSASALLALPREAALAHAVYAPEVRHPVEVGGDQEAHLATWLSHRLGHTVRIPDLGALGYSLVGGRLLPGQAGPSAQFMYEDRRGLRITLYVDPHLGATRPTAFRFTEEDGLRVLYWVEDELGYALSADELGREQMLAIARLIYNALAI